MYNIFYIKYIIYKKKEFSLMLNIFVSFTKFMKMNIDAFRYL